MSDLKWSFTIRDASTNQIYASDKMDAEYLVNNSIGKHKIKIKIKNNLLPGKYLLSGELREGTGIFFVGYSNKRGFEVKYGNKQKGNGIVYMDHKIIENIRISFIQACNSKRNF